MGRKKQLPSKSYTYQRHTPGAFVEGFKVVFVDAKGVVHAAGLIMGAGNCSDMIKEAEAQFFDYEMEFRRHHEWNPQ